MFWYDIRIAISVCVLQRMCVLNCVRGCMILCVWGVGEGVCIVVCVCASIQCLRLTRSHRQEPSTRTVQPSGGIYSTEGRERGRERGEGWGWGRGEGWGGGREKEEEGGEKKHGRE